MQESQAEQQGAELGERAGSGAPAGSGRAGGERRREGGREGRKEGRKKRPGSVVMWQWAAAGAGTGGLPAPLPAARPGGKGCGAEGTRGRRLLRAGRREPGPLMERPRGLPEGSVAMQPRRGGGCALAPVCWLSIAALGKAGLLVGKGRKPGRGSGGFIPASLVSRALPFQRFGRRKT